MSRILVFGNSGSGKTTLARTLTTSNGLAMLELDSLAWLPGSPPQRMPIEQTTERLEAFLKINNNWIIEGCYTDLLDLLKHQADEIIFLNLAVDDCVDNVQTRAFEPNKYSSEAAQQANQAMLIEWIKDYPHREDELSLSAHQEFFANFNGKKSVITRRSY